MGDFSSAAHFETQWYSTYTSVIDHSTGNETRVPLGQESRNRWIAGQGKTCSRCGGRGWVAK